MRARPGRAVVRPLTSLSGAVTGESEGWSDRVESTELRRATPQHSIMPGVITVPDFIREAREDFASPTTSTFVNRIPQCRETINRIDEVENVTFIITVL